MSSGGHAASGPAPSLDALRRERDLGDWIRLPAAGRQGEPPAWPLTAASKRELEHWQREWARPQALMWEKNGQEVEVALYVRSLAAAEKPKAPVVARLLVKQQQEILGISQPGLRRLRWLIDHGVEAEASLRRPPAKPIKERLKVLDAAG